MNSGMNRFPDKRDEERKFPLPKDPPAWQDKERVLLGLFKWDPLETQAQFAARIVRETKRREAELKAARAARESNRRLSVLQRLQQYFRRRKS